MASPRVRTASATECLPWRAANACELNHIFALFCFRAALVSECRNFEWRHAAHAGESPGEWGMQPEPKLPEHLVDGNWQVANAFAGGMIDGIGDGSGYSDNTDLAHALDSERVDDVVRLIDEDDLDVLYVGVHRHMILGDVGVHNATEGVIIKRFLMEGHADTPYDAPHDLTGGGLRIDDAPGGNRIDNACHADDPKLLVHLHFGEDRRVRVARMLGVFRKFSRPFVHDAISAPVLHHLRDRYRAP